MIEYREGEMATAVDRRPKFVKEIVDRRSESVLTTPPRLNKSPNNLRCRCNEQVQRSRKKMFVCSYK